jgi:cell division protein FtsI/penicillin-binding protein 2
MLATPMRYYPQRSLAAHVIGFVNDEPNAYYGVEQQYSNYLLSANSSFQESAPLTQEAYESLPRIWQRYLPSDVGQDLVLTIDRRIQFMVEQILADAIGRYAAESGTVIIIKPNTGAILAMASLPAYDPNRYGTSNDTVLIDPAISKQYEPGSVFKVITMAAGIDAGLITPDTIITDTKVLDYGDQEIQNWDKIGLGPITVTETLRRSRNVPTAQVAIKMGESLFYQYVRRFGFGQLTEVDLANESPGTVKVPGNPLWSQSDLATNSFGQGLAVTPLQVATAISVIANGGVLVRPHVAEAMVYQGQVLEPGSAVVRRVIKPDTASLMKDLMVDVVENGTKTAQIDGYTVAGKTGTAQIAIEGGYHLTQTIHSFVGFVPAEDPQFVALVKLDKPRAYAWAESTAAPTFAELASRILYLLNVPPKQVAAQP